eukprot:749529-Hanusia_phi.AAC.4
MNSFSKVGKQDPQLFQCAISSPPCCHLLMSVDRHMLVGIRQIEVNVSGAVKSPTGPSSQDLQDSHAISNIFSAVVKLNIQDRQLLDNLVMIAREIQLTSWNEIGIAQVSLSLPSHRRLLRHLPRRCSTRSSRLTAIASSWRSDCRSLCSRQEHAEKSAREFDSCLQVALPQAFAASRRPDPLWCCSSGSRQPAPVHRLVRKGSKDDAQSGTPTSHPSPHLSSPSPSLPPLTHIQPLPHVHLFFLLLSRLRAYSVDILYPCAPVG